MNIPKLKGVIAEKGIVHDDLRPLWGNCSRQTVSNKVNGKAPITLEEATKFSDYAGLTDTERANIFLSS